MKANRSTATPAGAAVFHRLHDERLAAKLGNNRAIAAAHARPSGPKFTSTVEVQPAPKRPRLQVR